jgi:hypothetical protein
MEEIRFDGLLQVQAAMQDLCGPLRPGESEDTVRRDYERAVSLFGDWSTAQIFSLHRTMFAMMMTRAAEEPHRIPGHCLCNVGRQLTVQIRMYNDTEGY